MPKDVLRDKDVQLDKAIEAIMNKIKNEPLPLLARPAYPYKSIPTLK